jgi:thiamine-phosphate pyrophosphorylase
LKNVWLTKPLSGLLFALDGESGPRSYNRPAVVSPMNGQTLRLLDANANRAREALRVIEDYARFWLNDQALSGDLKAIRHDLTGVTAAFAADAILYRDTPGDVGVANKTATELRRSDVNEVITAAGKRLGEALRAMEEFAKIERPVDAAKLEALRYRFYHIEMRVARTLRPASRFAQVKLCVLITEKLCRGPWLEVAEEAIEGGADCLQLREKDLEGGELLCRAKDFVKLCKARGVVSIINDRADIAILSDADGVHVGQTDLPAVEARKLIGHAKLLGVSTHNIGQAQQAFLDGADYIGVGPVFPSPTKPRDFLPGLAYAREVASSISIPALAIAGITPANVDEVRKTGIGGIAVTAAVIGCDDPTSAARELKRKFTTT